MDVNSYNALNAGWVPPRFISLFAAVRPNETVFSLWVCCGTDHSLEVKQEKGLWNDMLSRLAVANDMTPNAKSLIYPLPIRRPIEHWVYPANALVLDTIEGIAAALPWLRAVQYLKLNPSIGS